MHTFFLAVPHATLQEILLFPLVPLSDVKFRKEHGRFFPNRIFRVWNKSSMQWRVLWLIMLVLPDPCTAFRVSDSPNCPLMESGWSNWVLKTLVGPISFRHSCMASCRAKIAMWDRPLWKSMHVILKDLKNCFFYRNFMILSIIRVIKDGTWRSGMF